MEARIALVAPSAKTWVWSGAVVSSVRDAAVEYAFWNSWKSARPCCAFASPNAGVHVPSSSVAICPPASQTNCMPAYQYWPGM
ncbi:hypothetical protein BFL35_03230 [Clavibacter michiganensis]|nr:hypothetical protein BFL35_03230 [Clavibacter michiganensis]